MFIDLKASARAVNCQQVPPQCEVNYVPLHSPKPSRPIEGTFLNPRPLGVMTHFLDGVTSACIAAEVGCTHCLQGKRPRWKGFVGYYSFAVGRVCLLELTPNAFKNSRQLSDVNFNLRGYGFKAMRNGGAVNSRVSVLVSDRLTTATRLPPEFDPLPTLVRVWNAGFSSLKN